MVNFSPNTPMSQRVILDGLLKLKMVEKLDGYLDLSISVGKKKSIVFQNIMDRIASRINSWSKRLLSNGGKEIFIKSIIQAIPTYAFSVSWHLRECLRIFSRWWVAFGGGRGKEEGWNMVPWDQRCYPKGMGGLGFRDLRLFDVAFLHRQVWRLINSRDMLCFRVLSAKYFLDDDVFHPKSMDKTSYTWQSIAKAACIL